MIKLFGGDYYASLWCLFYAESEEPADKLQERT